MEVSCRATRILLEAAETAGVPRAQIVQGSSFDEAYLTDTRKRIDWAAFTALLERLSTLVDHDPARLRAIGAALVSAPGNHIIRRLAASVVTPHQLYQMADRWIGPALFPHLRFASHRLADGRLRSSAALAPGVAESLPFFELCAGAIPMLPTLLGLPPAEAEVETTPRAVVMTLRLPRPRSAAHRIMRTLRAAAARSELVELLEEQRRELDRSYSAALRGNEDFRLLLESLPDMVVIHRAGRILWANHALGATLGWDEPKVLFGQPLLSLVHPEDRERVADRMTRPPMDAELPALAQFRLVRRDGATIVAEITPAQEVSFGGAPARLVAGRDVTEHVRMQQQLVLADRMASLGVLAAGVAHEINNPLAYAMGSVELAARHLARHDEAAAKGALSTALDGLDRVRTIVKDLKTFSRGDEDSLAAVDVRAALESTLTLAGKQIARRARVVRDYGPAPPAWANAARLGQVFLNLVLNAVEAMPEDGDHELRLCTKADAAGHVVVEVSDTGEGIAEEHLSRIFEPFFTTKPVGTGTGLGLAVCHQIVAGLGGTIDVTSTRGVGSTFRVTLPASPAVRQEAPAPRTTPAGTASAGDGRRARVLVIDDEPHFASLLRRVLERHDVAVAPSARAALPMLTKGGGTFDVIVCDLMMPDLSGPELHEELARTRPELCDRMIFMTGGAFTERAKDFLAHHPNRCLEKPFEPAELLALVEERLARLAPHV